MAGGGGALLSASLKDLLDRIDSREVVTFLRGQKLNAKLLRKLTIKLLAVQIVLDDAEAKQFTKSAVKVWMDELRDAVYDAEDLLDDITTEALRCKMEMEYSVSESQCQVRNINFGEGIKSRVEEITETLEYLSEKKDVLGLKEGVVGNLSKRRTRTSLVDESGICGRQDDINLIVDILSSSSNSSGNKISVIALVGMGGIGKTTLAQLVYKDRRVVDCFDLQAWVCVSEEFDLIRITKTILNAITPGTPERSFDDNDLNMLQCKLEESLSRKKLLLVLDDVWNESYNEWEKLQLPFNAGRNGSKIIVTTRSDKVASIMRSIAVHHLGQLPFEDCWSLFAKHAFENGDSSPHPKLEEIGREIVKKCKGLPLTAKTLGAALYSELRLKEWENVLNSKVWDLPNDEILPALRLSYFYLPSQLKRCFAYCSIFPKDYEFEKENLILLWMAEGFLQQTEGKTTMEELGDAYFSDLLSRSFFQKSSIHKSYFVMHDLINDLAQLVSGKFCVQLKDGKINENTEKLRHLSYFRSEHDNFERFETLNEVNGLRTFLSLHFRTLLRFDKVSKTKFPYIRLYSGVYLSNRVQNDLLPKTQYLRVLSLSYYWIHDLPDSIGNLKHLYYLDLTQTAIKRLPNSICSLYNLQTLILYNCFRLVELPKMMGKMISLRHLDIKNSKVKEMPSQMGQLKGLQKLSNYRVGKQSGTMIGELREISHISGSLSIQGLQNVVDAKDASEANLVGKLYLDELHLEWDRDSDIEQNMAEEVLNNLQPHSNLKRLTIYRYGGSRFSDWFGGSSILNMVSLRLWYCDNVSALPPLGQLLSLKHLYILGLEKIKRVGAEFYGTEPCFVSLKVLSFQSMSKWKEWLCLGGQGGEFPCLKELYVDDCPKLTGDLPTHLPFLRILVIESCKRLVAPLPRVPAIHDLTTRSHDISQWKHLPPLLQKLSIANFDSMESHLLEEGMLQRNTSLEELRIRNCSLSKPLYRLCLPLALKSLTVWHCEKLEFLLPEFFKCHLPFLQYLEINDGTVNSFLSLPLGNFPKVRHLMIVKLEGLEFLSISTSDRDLPSFDWLSIDLCPNLVSICCKNMKVACFRTLRLSSCPELIFPVQGLPSSLTSLRIIKCDKFTSQMEFGLQGLPSLTSLYMSDLPSLISLDNLKLQLLTSLQILEICNCPELHSFTDKRLPTSLSFVEIQNCPLLKDWFKSWPGEDGPSIAHIPHIVINNQVLE